VLDRKKKKKKREREMDWRRGHKTKIQRDNQKIIGVCMHALSGEGGHITKIQKP